MYKSWTPYFLLLYRKRNFTCEVNLEVHYFQPDPMFRLPSPRSITSQKESGHRNGNIRWIFTPHSRQELKKSPKYLPLKYFTMPHELSHSWWLKYLELLLNYLWPLWEWHFIATKGTSDSQKKTVFFKTLCVMFLRL